MPSTKNIATSLKDLEQNYPAFYLYLRAKDLLGTIKPEHFPIDLKKGVYLEPLIKIEALEDVKMDFYTTLKEDQYGESESLFKDYLENKPKAKIYTLERIQCQLTGLEKKVLTSMKIFTDQSCADTFSQNDITKACEKSESLYLRKNNIFVDRAVIAKQLQEKECVKKFCENISYPLLSKIIRCAREEGVVISDTALDCYNYHDTAEGNMEMERSIGDRKKTDAENTFIAKMNIFREGIDGKKTALLMNLFNEYGIKYEEPDVELESVVNPLFEHYNEFCNSSIISSKNLKLNESAPLQSLKSTPNFVQLNESQVTENALKSSTSAKRLYGEHGIDAGNLKNPEKSETVALLKDMTTLEKDVISKRYLQNKPNSSLPQTDGRS